MRPFRQEVLTVLAALALPAILWAVFPSEALRFQAKDDSGEGLPDVLLVTLSSDEEGVALARAKGLWQAEVSAGRRMWAYLPLGELPEDPRKGPILAVRPAQGLDQAFGVTDYPSPAYSPRAAAPAPVRLKAMGETVRPVAFAKDELLKLP